jgi:hypothetical protein
MRLPVIGYAQRVTDTVERAMNILKDRKDPAEKPQSSLSAKAPPTSRSNARSSR